MDFYEEGPGSVATVRTRGKPEPSKFGFAQGVERVARRVSERPEKKDNVPELNQRPRPRKDLPRYRTTRP